MTSRRLAAATIFSRNKAPPNPLIRLSERRSTSSAPSIVKSMRWCSAKLASDMPRLRACVAVRSEVGIPTILSPFATRAPSPSTTKKAVEPVPRPTTMPSSTYSTARYAASCLSLSRLTGIGSGPFPRGAIDKPHQLADRRNPRRRQCSLAGEDPFHHGRLVGSRGDEGGRSTAVERRKCQGYTRDMRVQSGLGHFGDPTLVFLQCWFTGKQRGGVAVRPHTEQHDVEQRPDGIEPVAAVIGLELALIYASGVCHRSFEPNAVDILGRDRHMRDHGVAGHAVIAVGVVPRDEPVVAPEQMHAIPRHLVAQRRGSEQLIEPLRRRTAGERDGEPARRRAGKVGDPLRDALRQRFEIGRDVDPRLPSCHIRPYLPGAFEWRIAAIACA